ncbi:ANTAR domain-containing protein [Mycolicibacterium sp. 050158]|nr:ANTAR domain-containing protein [Mycolicibacterium sp. 050158]MDX1890675.1 ANTAR domain-containing protein [Mycolicibacterium sp. 050158]
MRASLAVLTPEQLADVVVSRVRIERAKGFLMQVYDIDADRAFTF